MKKLIAWIAGGVLFIGAAVFVFVQYAKNMELPPLKSGAPSVVYAADNKTVIGNITSGKPRTVLKREEIPVLFDQLLMAGEDRRFYTYTGISWKDYTRATIFNVTNGAVIQGAGGVTGQYVRNAYLNHDRTGDRKRKEIQYSFAVEQQKSKEDIIAAYFNIVFFGCDANSLADAARNWFNVSIKDIGDPKNATHLAIGSFLIALVQSPSTFDDTNESGGLIHIETIRKRQLYILDGLTKLEGVPDGSPQAKIPAADVIAKARAEVPKLKPVCKSRASGSSSIDKYLLQHIKDVISKTQAAAAKEDGLDDNAAAIKGQANMEAMLANGNLHITTSIDPALQKNLTAAAEAKRPKGGVDVGVVLLNPYTGGVAAMYGAHALDARRQPGSTVKPFILLDAVSRGVSVKSEVSAPRYYTDSAGKQIWNNNREEDFDGCKITLEEAMARSINVPWVSLATSKMPSCPDASGAQGFTEIKYNNHVTLETVSKRLVDFGFEDSLFPGETNSSEIKLDPRLAIGDTLHISPLKLAVGAGTLATGGDHIKPHIVSSIKTDDGRELFKNNAKLHRVADRKHVEIVNRVLTTVVTHPKGTANGINTNQREYAFKTGTTLSDAWAFGFPAFNTKDKTPDIACAGWLGFADSNKPIAGLASSRNAAEICVDALNKSLGNTRVKFANPKDEGTLVGIVKPIEPSPSAAPAPPSKEPVKPKPSVAPSPAPSASKKPEPNPTPSPSKS